MFTIAALLLVTASPAARPAAPGAATVRKVGEVALQPGGAGYVDYLMLSPDGRTLYAGNASANALGVVATRTMSVKTLITGLTNVRGVALVPERHIGFTSNRKANTVGVVDLRTNRVMETLPGGGGPDGLVYDRAAGLVCIANAEGHSVSLIDPANRSVVATVPVGGKPEFPAADSATGTLYEELETTSEIVVVDPASRTVTARYPLSPGEGPSGMALDAVHHRLFVGCLNSRLVVMNTDTGAVVSTLPIGEDVDCVVYDAGLRRIYVANGGSGTMTVIRQKSPDEYEVIENVQTFPKAHAMALDTRSHRLYLVHADVITAYDPVRDAGGR